MTNRQSMLRAIAGAVAFAAVAALAQATPGLPVWGFVFLVMTLALPVVLLGAALSALDRGHWLLLLTEDGMLRRVLSGAPLRLAVHAALGMGVAGLALMRMMVMEQTDWLALLVGGSVMLLLLRSGLVQGWLVTGAGALVAARAARWVGAVVSVLAAFVLLLAFPPEAGIAAIAPATTRSAVVGELWRLALLGKELEGFVLGHLAEPDGWSRLGALIYIALGVFSVSWAMISVLAIALLPGGDVLRGLAPASVTALAPGRRAIVAAVLAGSVLVAGVMGVAFRLEARLASVPAAERPIAEIAHLFAEFRTVEQIDGRFFSKGAMAEIEAVRLEEPLPVMISPDRAQVELATLAGEGFDAMVANVDLFLDRYYSLSGEYGRIAALTLGQLEDRMRDDLTTALAVGDPMGALQDRRLALLAEDAGARAEFEAVQARRAVRIAAILDRYRIEPSDLPPGVILDVAGVFTLPAPEMPPIDTRIYLEDTTQRMQGGAVAGAVVAALVVRRIVGKGVLRLAAKAVTKAVAARGTGAIGGAGAGAAGGAAAGSVVPGLGTAIGAVVGGLAGGVAAWIATDYALLKLEEYFQRDSFRAEIVAAIEEQRAVVLGQIVAQ